MGTQLASWREYLFDSRKKDNVEHIILDDLFVKDVSGQFKKDFENVNKENVKDYHVPDFDVSTPMLKVKPPRKAYIFEQEENEDLSVDTKDKK